MRVESVCVCDCVRICVGMEVGGSVNLSVCGSGCGSGCGSEGVSEWGVLELECVGKCGYNCGCGQVWVCVLCRVG